MNAETPAGTTPTGVKAVLWIAAVFVALGVSIYIAFQVSPWPSVWLIRNAFDKDAERASQALAKHVPSGVQSVLNERYDPAGNALLDVYYPQNTAGPLLAVVWVHGGGWISGGKDQIGNYAKVVASRGFTVVSVDYSLAPEAVYPEPVKQVNTALAYLLANAQRLHVDTKRIVLAGDSAGSHIVAQLAVAIGEPTYAKSLGIEPSLTRSQLLGMLLYCGPYDTRNVDLHGGFGDFLRTVLWSYSGGKDFQTNPRFATASVIDYVTSNFPPAFISAGNTEPLLPQSKAFADKLLGLGVYVDTLFFPADYSPALPHEYQFNLDVDAGNVALQRSVAFLKARSQSQ